MGSSYCFIKWCKFYLLYNPPSTVWYVKEIFLGAGFPYVTTQLGLDIFFKKYACEKNNGGFMEELLFTPGFGRKDVVEHLLDCGASVHARDDGGLIPLHNACSFGHAEVVQLLLRHGADGNARDNWNYTPLHEAAIKGKIDVCIGKYYVCLPKQ